MELELKHLAPYLPYQLKWSLQDVKTFTMSGITHETLYTEEGAVLNWSLKYNLPQALFPILRPLSDLSNMDNAISEHSINMLISEKYNIDYGIFSQYKSELDIELDGDSDLGYDPGKNLPFNVVIDIYNELLKGHYDIFSLIDKGIAIDINSLETSKL